MAPRTVLCDRCQRPIGPGAPRYDMTLRLTSGFDGVLLEPEPGVTLLDAMGECLDATAEDLEEQVDLLRSYVLCPGCRDLIASDPLQQRQ